MTPEIVPRSELQPAIALNSMGINAARAIGPALAGIIVSAAGAEALVQAQKLGARVSVPASALKLHCDDTFHSVSISGDEKLCAKTVVIASGAEYRRPEVPGCREFEGRGVYYGATPMEAQLCRGGDAIVGGGNSAGQAAVFLSKFARAVDLVIRSADLTQSMSATSSGASRKLATLPCIHIPKSSNLPATITWSK